MPGIELPADQVGTHRSPFQWLVRLQAAPFHQPWKRGSPPIGYQPGGGMGGGMGGEIARPSVGVTGRSTMAESDDNGLVTGTAIDGTGRGAGTP